MIDESSSPHAVSELAPPADEHRPTDHVPVTPAREPMPPHQSESIPEGQGLRAFIPLADLEVGECYELESRNLPRGVWDGEKFHGIRLKFGKKFIDTEVHWDLDDHYGTAQAIRKLE